MAEGAAAAAADRLCGDDKAPRHHHGIEGDNSNNSNNDNVDLLLVRTAVERYLDENRTSTDPLSARQMRAWTLQWVPRDEADSAAKEDVCNDNGDDDPASAASTATAAAAAATIARSGCLLWKGEHLAVSLHVHCRYGKNELHFSVRASASASASPSVPSTTSDEIDEGERKKGDIPGPSASSSSKPSNTTIRSKMLQRLSHDDYVAKIWKASDDDDDHDDDARRPILCEAHIVAVPEEEEDGAAQAGRHRHASYEERYDTDEGTAEAIRRAVWGASSSDAMDVWEFVLQHLPLLPSGAAAAGAASADHTMATTNESGAGSTDCKTPSTLSLLADRARLRLLEDAMCDACERHGDDGMVNELTIANEDEKEETHRGEEEKNDGGGKSDDNNNINSNRGDRHGRPNSNNDSSSSSNSPVALPQQLDVAGSSRGPRGGGGGRRRRVKRRR
jgi:hypothetical protein